MKTQKDTFKSLISVKNYKGFKPEKALEHLGLLVDFSSDLKQKDGLKAAIKLSNDLKRRRLAPEQLAVLQYFQANIWGSLRLLSRKSPDWEQMEMEKEIFYLRSALNGELPIERKIQVYTNLANLYNNIGRFVEAIEYYDKAIDILPSFNIANGNKGTCLVDFAHFYVYEICSQDHAGLFLKHAYSNLKIASQSNLGKNARVLYDKYMVWIESVLKKEYLDEDFDLDGFSLGSSKKEVQYRKWCLKNRVLLNFLNDLGPYAIAAEDNLKMPPIVMNIGEGPYYHGYFNQMKQEFVSARYLYYEGINTVKTHFSDKGVSLCNTFDYPAYSLAVEKVKNAFKMTYSLFDKIAFFLNKYLDLSMEERNVSFRTLWYEKRDGKRCLKTCFDRKQNSVLRGLFWLSKDLFEDKPGFRKSIEPEAQELNIINNHLKHKYLKLHDDLWRGPSTGDDDLLRGLTDTLSFSLYRKDFESKTLKLVKMVRAALIYLTCAVYSEELHRKKMRDPKSIVPQSFLDDFDDKWKV